MEDATPTTTTMIPLYYENDRYVQPIPCAECKSTTCYTRILFYDKEPIIDAKYLCYCCTENYTKRGYKLLTVEYQSK